MNLQKRRLSMNSFFKSQFIYWPLISMWNSRANDRKTNRLHERCLRIICNNNCVKCVRIRSYSGPHSVQMWENTVQNSSEYRRFLRSGDTVFISVSIHVLNPHVWATEIYKVSNDQSTTITKATFPISKIPGTLKPNSQFSRYLLETLYHGTESTLNIGPKIGDLVPSGLNEIDDLKRFTQVIKKWKPENCSCQLCKVSV